MIIDSHCHAWEYWPYEPPVPDPKSRALVEQLIFEMNQCGVDRAVLVAARIEHNPFNNNYVADAVRSYPERLHQFADVDCKWSPEYHTPGAVERLISAAETFPLQGFTHYVDSTNDGWFRSAEGMAFFGAAAERRLIASVAASPVWQDDIRHVARAFPTMPILCHHLAGLRPGRGDAAASMEQVLESAACPNIYIKVSGFYYGAAEAWAYPFVSALNVVAKLHDHFGTERLVWGSDYPVSRPNMTYRQSLEVVRSHCGFLMSADIDRIMGDNLEGLLAHAGSNT